VFTAATRIASEGKKQIMEIKKKTTCSGKETKNVNRFSLPEIYTCVRCENECAYRFRRECFPENGVRLWFLSGWVCWCSCTSPCPPSATARFSSSACATPISVRITKRVRSVIFLYTFATGGNPKAIYLAPASPV